MTTATSAGAKHSSDTTNHGTSSHGPVHHGHRRQESMYAMTGLYSERTSENDDCPDDSIPSASNYRSETIVKCHSRNPSSSIIEKPSLLKKDNLPESAALALQTDLKQCGIFSCRPDCLQRFSSIKVVRKSIFFYL